MTYVLLDDNFGDSNSWKVIGTANNWTLERNGIVLDSEHNNEISTIVLEIIDLEKEQISLKETNSDMQYVLRTSEKQNIE